MTPLRQRFIEDMQLRGLAPPHNEVTSTTSPLLRRSSKRARQARSGSGPAVRTLPSPREEDVAGKHQHVRLGEYTEIVDAASASTVPVGSFADHGDFGYYNLAGFGISEQEAGRHRNEAGADGVEATVTLTRSPYFFRC